MAKTLVVYYSYTGNGKKIALYAKEKLQADLLELLPVEPFSDDYDAVVEEWQNNELKRDVEIKDIGVDLSIYDKVVLITCTWWYGISPVMKKFLKEYDLSGKDVLVGSTNAGWLGHSLKDYEALLPNSHIKGELNIVFSANEQERDKLVTPMKEVDEWLLKL